jgi:catechol 2,3-dioxygenase-like lactoylglutathione lyase family enzyme
MDKNIPGIHHLTAIASDPQRNLDFYTGALGLRLVKLTVKKGALIPSRKRDGMRAPHHWQAGSGWACPSRCVSVFVPSTKKS